MRTKPTTSFTTRSKPTSSWICQRCLNYLTWDSSIITFDSSEITFDMTHTGGLETNFTSERYDKYILDLNGSFIVDLLGNKITGVSGDLENTLQTNWN